MADELKIVSKTLKLDNRSKIFLGRRELSRQIQGVLLYMDRDKNTEACLVFKPKGVKVNAKALKSDDILGKLYHSLVKAKREDKQGKEVT